MPASESGRYTGSLRNPGADARKLLREGMSYRSSEKLGWVDGRRRYSEKSLGWAEEAAAAGLRRATPTTPRTVREEMAERGTKMRSVLEERSGGVSWTPLSRRDKRSLVTTPSSVSPSV